MVYEYFFKIRMMKEEEPWMKWQFYSNGKRYITESINPEGREEVSEEIYQQMMNLSKKLIEEDNTLPVWIKVERQQLTLNLKA